MDFDLDETGQETVGLWFTNACNLNCSYCYIKEKNGDTISLKEAMGILSPQLGRTGGPLMIDLMGAEPLTQFDRLREIVEETLRGRWKREFGFRTVTNGTLLTPERKEWFREHRWVMTLCLSCDGEADSQNRNRCDSAGAIDYDFFLETWPEQPWKMTVSRDTAPFLDRNAIALHKRSVRFTANAAYEADPWPDEAVLAYEAALFRLADYYLEHPEITPCNLIGQPPASLLAGERERQPRYCSAGNSFYFFGMDGGGYPCHMLSPLALPAERAVRGAFFPPEADYQDPRCHKCVLRCSCYTCLGANHLYRGDLRLRDPLHCRLFQAQVRADMHFYLGRIPVAAQYTPWQIRQIEALKRLQNAFDRGGIGMDTDALEIK